MAGALILVATPIGNLGDLSPRAEEALRTADAIACEDTRHSLKLLSHAGIKNHLFAVHEHNENEAAQKIVDRINAGETIAMITDAGMPAISDPGERVVAAVAAAGLKVSVVPGPSAVPAALAISGLPTDRFCFEGFLPQKASLLAERLSQLAKESRTTVLYEAPHRLADTVASIAEACGPERRIVLVRELTKLHEEVWRGTTQELTNRLTENPVKGECVLVLEGATTVQEIDDATLLEALRAEVAKGTRKSEAAALISGQFNIPRNHVYDLVKQL